MEQNEKKKLITFIAVAYGLTLVMSLLMMIGLRAGKDLTSFINVQMTYPACGVMLGLLLFGSKEKKIPRAGFIVFLITAAVMLLISLSSLFLSDMTTELNGQSISLSNLYSQYVLMAGSVIAYILFWVSGREKRKNAGLSRNNLKLSILMVILFIVLYFARLFIALAFSVLSGEVGSETISQMAQALFTPSFISSALILLVNVPLTIVCFLGEEYGWRAYFQPVLQKKFGLRLGVIILGLLWAVWHIFVDYMYYSPGTGLQRFVTQIITCICLAAFFGYAYMKTNNIWPIAIMHFINNNYAALMLGGDPNALANQSVSWSQIPAFAISFIIFFLFIFAPAYGKKDKKILLLGETDEMQAL